MRRMQWIDLARGMAIVLVVFRHSIVGLNRSGINVPQILYDLQEYTYNFRMPVFFALSGIFLAKSLKNKGVLGIMNKKIATLLYPYLIWTFIFISLQILFSGYTNTSRTFLDYTYILIQPRNLDHMWYLLALFNTSMLYLVIDKWWHPGSEMHILFSLILYLISYFIRDFSLLSDLFYHYVFLVFGAVLSDQIISGSTANIKTFLKGVILLFPIFLFGQWAWQKLIPGNIFLQIPFLLIILVACLFFYFLCNLINSAGLFKFLQSIGRNSLPIYILHIMVISAVRIIYIYIFHMDDPYIILIVSMILGILIPMLIYKFGKPFGIEFLFEWRWKMAS